MSRASSRRALNAVSRQMRRQRGITARAFMDTLSTAGRASDVPAPTLLTCSVCRRLVTTLVDGECFVCHAPAEGKNFGDMTPAQREALHICGIKHGQHVDGFDGNWIDCEEAKRRGR